MKKIIALLVMFSFIFTGCAGITNGGKKSGDEGNRADAKVGGTVESDNPDTNTTVRIRI